jgi:methylmalonyl-CoA mutase C-terminal domain/subunit
VSVVCVSILSGAHMTLLPKIVDLLRQQDASDILILAGGTIPDADIPKLKDAGIAEVFTPGTDTRDVVAYIRSHVKAEG